MIIRHKKSYSEIELTPQDVKKALEQGFDKYFSRTEKNITLYAKDGGSFINPEEYTLQDFLDDLTTEIITLSTKPPSDIIDENFNIKVYAYTPKNCFNKRVHTYVAKK